MNASSPITARLFAMKDEAYADFSAKLIPNIPRETILGVRLPALRVLARGITGSDEAAFLSDLPHFYHEENMLHAILVSREKALPALIEKLDAFLPFVTNWAVCDTIRPAVFSRRFDEALPHFRRWIASGEPYTVRLGVGMLMAYGLGANFRPECNALAAGAETGDHYVNMMRAWYFATALAKQWDDTVPWLDGRLDARTNNMTVRKAIESYRVTAEHKELLRKKTVPGVPGCVSVAAAVIRCGGKVLICRRPEGKARALSWEFPGGKLERGESAEEALVRECGEELAVNVRPVRSLVELPYDYPDVSIRLIAIEAEIESGELTAKEHSQLRFVLPSELSSFALSPADRQIAGSIVLLSQKRPETAE